MTPLPNHVLYAFHTGMPTPEHYCIAIEGQISRVRERFVIDDGQQLGHLLKMLLTGHDIPDSAWRPYGIRVSIEHDMDQG